jgi:hypothetical protein
MRWISFAYKNNHRMSAGKFLITPICAVCTSHLILDLITLYYIVSLLIAPAQKKKTGNVSLNKMANKACDGLVGAG